MAPVAPTASTSSLHSTPTQRALAIPELLDIVCASLDSTKDVLGAALVSRRWSGPALDRLWYAVNDLRVLFGVLAPVVGDVDDGEGLRDIRWRFARPLLPSDWARFEKYGRRVRALIAWSPPAGSSETTSSRSFPSIPSKSRRPAHTNDTSAFRDLFDEAFRTRLKLHILPNLRFLSWDAHLSCAVLFMSPTVKEFRFPLANPEKVAYESDSSWGGVRDVRERMGGALEVLGVWAERPVGEVERVLMELFVGDGDGEAIIPRWFSGPEDEAGGPWPKLRTLVLPKHFMTSSLFTTLSGFPALRTIEFRYDTDDHSLPSDSTSFSPSFTKSKPFPVLDDLSFTVPLSSVASLFSTGPEGLLKSLTSLYVHSYEFESPSSFHALLLALSISTPHLKLLALLSSVLPTTAQAQDDQRITQHQQRITYTDLLPIHAQKHLTTLEIIHHLPLRLTLDDIVYMARAFGEGMEVVVLGNEPFGIMQDLDLLGLVDEGEHGDDEGDREGDGEEGDGMHGALTLEAIYAFARFCPNLSKLGLFVDARSVPRFPPMHQDLRPSEALGLESGLTLGGGTGLGGETGGLGRGTGLTPWDTGELGYGFNGDVVLSMGLSPVGDEGEVAMYLSRLACSAASSVGSSSSSSAALGKHNDRQGLGKLAQTPSFYSLTDLNTSVLSLSPSTFSLSPMPITAATRGVFPDPPIEGLRRIGIECGLSVDEALQYTPVTMIPIAGMTMTAVANAFMVMNSNPSTDLRTSTHLRNSAAGWKGVGKMMPLLVKMRWEEEVRNGGLRREVRDLRMRVDVLGGGGGVESRSWGGSKLEEGQQEVGKGKGKEAERKKGKGVPGVGSGADRVRAVGMGLKRRLSSMLF